MRLKSERRIQSLDAVRVRRASSIHRRHRNRMVEKILIVSLFAFVLNSLPQTSLTLDARADELSALMNSSPGQSANHGQAKNPDGKLKAVKDPCLVSVPTPQLKSGLHRVVQLVNCSQTETLLGTANAAEQLGQQALPVLPREGTWEMRPFNPGAPDHANVLTIDVPLGWEDTKCPNNKKDCNGIIGPRFWARTACRYDLAFDIAQCETGGCSGRYDCSAARLSSSVGTTISEWTFAEPVPDGQPAVYLKDSPDISAVDGANLNMDIQPVGGTAHDPFDLPPDWSLPNNPPKGHDIQWLAEQYPLTIHGQDLREDTNCNGTSGVGCCPPEFRLQRSTLTTGNPYGFVIVDSPGHPLGGDATVACFSNCAKYEFPTSPLISCDEKSDPTCFNWKAFCLGDPSKYGQPCTKDSDCQVGGGCWDNPGSTFDHTCQGRAFIKAATCPENVCTYPYGYVDNVTDPPITYHSTQPPFGNCSDVTSDPSLCIGDDTLHAVMPKAYTWPNDPQVYGDDAPAYRVIFEPGGTEKRPARIGSNSIPACSSLPNIYGYGTQYGGPTSGSKPCDNSVNLNGALFAVANANPHGQSDPTGKNDWACNPDPTGSNNQGVVCRWAPVSPIQQVGLRWNFNSAGSSLQLARVPGVTNGDLLLASITFFSGASATPPSGWTQVTGASVLSNSNDQTVVWYHFVGANPEPATYMWTWTNATASPAGAITAWRGVNAVNPFDVAASIDNGIGATATAPAITTITANAQLVSVFGAGGASGQAFALPANETGAVKVNGGPTVGTWYAHLVADKPQKSAGPTLPQAVVVTTNPGGQNGGDWTAISLALRP
jgi:hypothetical protein